MAGLCEGGNEPSGSLKAICNHDRMERVKWADTIRNEVGLERVGKERISLKLIRKRKKGKFVGSLAEKKLPTEACTGRNGEREKSSG
ncbi:hypothetical protein ANN_17251 [Periplaneta americana]|uniref:Uncharacterized protein n=1 Tax=Periplaneta americana TaxID=6978 RepID=A0ABQ8STP8_PERAM|nr:hypothetical protein ANN_17251 [Periplaneta americana]